jgi:hypothetical protein
MYCRRSIMAINMASRFTPHLVLISASSALPTHPLAPRCLDLLLARHGPPPLVSEEIGSFSGFTLNDCFSTLKNTTTYLIFQVMSLTLFTAPERGFASVSLMCTLNGCIMRHCFRTNKCIKTPKLAKSVANERRRIRIECKHTKNPFSSSHVKSLICYTIPHPI